MIISHRILPRIKPENVSIRLSPEALDALDRESACHRLPVRTLLRAIIGAWLAQRGHRVKECGLSGTVAPVDTGNPKDFPPSQGIETKQFRAGDGPLGIARLDAEERRGD